MKPKVSTPGVRSRVYEEFSKEDEDLLQFYCKILAHSIQNAQLYEHEIEARERLKSEAEDERQELLRRSSLQQEMISTLTSLQ